MLRVAIPPGIGDIYWSALKLEGIRTLHPGEDIHAVVQANPIPRHAEFLRMLPTVASFSEEEYVPYRFVGPDGATSYPASRRVPLPGPEWRAEQVPSGQGVLGFDYFLWANKHLEDGHRIEDWLPEIPLDWQTPILIPKASVHRAGQLAASFGDRGFFCIYTSALWGNTCGMQNGNWAAHHWMEVVRAMWDWYHAPTVLLGAEWDRDYADMLDRWGCPYLYNLVGRTALAETLALLLLSSGFVGYASGLPILSTHLRVPTVMLWPDSSTPTRYGVWHKKGMQTAWVNPETLARGRYLPVEFQDATPERICAWLAARVEEDGREHEVASAAVAGQPAGDRLAGV